MDMATALLMAARRRKKPGSLFLAVAHSGSPYLTLLAHDNGSLSAADTYTLPDTGRGVAFTH